MKRSIIYILLALGCLVSRGGYAQLAYDARSAGMGFSNGAATRGLQQVGLNPATLALPNSYRFEFNLFSVVASVNNNSFKKSQYDRYFTTGNLLSEQDVDDILNSIPATGLRVDALARVNTLSFYLPNFSLSLTGVGAGKLTIPRDIVELPLRGNVDPGRIYQLDDAEGGDWAGVQVTASGAFPVYQSDQSLLRFAAAGLTIHYLSGLRYDEIIRSEGEIRDFDNEQQNPYLSINALVEIISAEGGRGAGIDLGGIFEIQDQWTVGVTLVNALSGIKWDNGTEKQILSIRGDSLNLPDRLQDSLIVDTDTTFAIGSFTTHLPQILDLAVAYQWRSDVLLTAEWEQGLSDRMGGAKRFRLAFGGEYRGIPLLPLRMGFSFGGKIGSSIALGVGLDLQNWYMDFAYINHGRIVPDDYKGATLALTTRFRF